MTMDPTCVTPSTPISKAASLMRAEDVGSLPVVDGDRLVGVITDRDIVTRVVAEGLDTERTGVGEVATGDLVMVEPGLELQEALRIMAARQVRRLPVVEGESLIGMLAQADVAREAQPTATGTMVEEISEPAPDEPHQPAV
jgi:CBS domain-containing protein